MSGAGGHQHRTAISRVQDDVVHNMAEEDRFREPPVPAGLISAQDEGALSGSDQQGHRACPWLGPVIDRDGSDLASPRHCKTSLSFMFINNLEQISKEVLQIGQFIYQNIIKRLFIYMVI